MSVYFVPVKTAEEIILGATPVAADAEPGAPGS